MLVEITPAMPGIELALAYATPENLTGQPIYRRAGCYLHADAVPLLARAAVLAQPLGYRLKIFDAFRPVEAQWALWNAFPIPGFVSDPRTGSVPHCRGVAVDLTLIDFQGQELDMGTGFDDPSAKSWHGDTEVSTEAQRNRYILLGIMSAAGWDFYAREWWHYQLFQPRRYPVLSDSVLASGLMPPAGG
ncbi:MAG: D-alanyl-D-alanine dipeptidase [Alphaproteobacteria bacterium]|nr:D-alanyl-D-alanine dipeptidase [Alphaproteobacteria bacterium]MBU0796553.1 D-alanyl-D-alanine dipeptidase [Alphaproteobacteria bacterium]MBU0886378.1 D-alanyl-D-alanine dipeptidase [Alphaproteobacteria bacterium]MBU1813426.1 D-alanyl-D-alanine dipeptidase [Alphaproteobacteria bacterium]MBU2090134.1 D-alanyl-D-alanine dipeptidase [Alphaproteobacteria bacterium]